MDCRNDYATYIFCSYLTMWTIDIVVGLLLDYLWGSLVVLRSGFANIVLLELMTAFEWLNCPGASRVQYTIWSCDILFSYLNILWAIWKSQGLYDWCVIGSCFCMWARFYLKFICKYLYCLIPLVVANLTIWIECTRVVFLYIINNVYIVCFIIGKLGWSTK